MNFDKNSNSSKVNLRLVIIVLTVISITFLFPWIAKVTFHMILFLSQ